MANKPQQVAGVVEDGAQLGHLYRMLKQQQALLEQIREILPAPLNAHCLHARIDGKRLILHTDSPAWSTGLRFHAPRIIAGLNSLAPNLNKVDVRIIIEQEAKATTDRRNHLSGKTAALIRELADSLEDEALRAAFKRLGRASRGDETR